MSSTPARALGAVAAAPAVAVLTALVAGSATAPPDSGLAWPDGDYTVILEGGRAASGSGGDVTSAEATGELTGTFDITVGGGAEPAFVAYLSSLTNLKFSATQYALLSSLMLLLPRLLGGYSGVMVEHLGYSDFFLVTALLGVPTLILIAWQWSRDRQQPGDAQREAASEQS